MIIKPSTETVLGSIIAGPRGFASRVVTLETYALSSRAAARGSNPRSPRNDNRAKY